MQKNVCKCKKNVCKNAKKKHLKTLFLCVILLPENRTTQHAGNDRKKEAVAEMRIE